MAGLPTKAPSSGRAQRSGRGEEGVGDGGAGYRSKKSPVRPTATPSRLAPLPALPRTGSPPKPPSPPYPLSSLLLGSGAEAVLLGRLWIPPPPSFHLSSSTRLRGRGPAPPGRGFGLGRSRVESKTQNQAKPQSPFLRLSVAKWVGGGRSWGWRGGVSPKKIAGPAHSHTLAARSARRSAPNRLTKPISPILPLATTTHHPPAPRTLKMRRHPHKIRPPARTHLHRQAPLPLRHQHLLFLFPRHTGSPSG